ncbi:MAG TPA: O-methyltransferase [Terriglobales bacterium]|nr:O-methyltransferase [Terriglobales bacterium]
MSPLLAPALEQYLYQLLPPSPPVLAEMEKQARERDIPIVGPAVARVLRLLAELTGARRVFELGSAIGYSTLWWAAAVGEGGEVFYTDSDPANCQEAAGYFERARLSDRIRILQGDAIAMLAATPGDFDIVFCDLNKPQYPEALRQAAPRIKPGGLLVADNVLWSGRVASTDDTSESTVAIKEFNRMIYSDLRLEPVILPLRDGVAVCRRVAA